MQLTPLLADNPAAQKTLPRCFRRTTQSISALVLGSQGDGWLVLARPVASAPPPLLVAAASPPPETRRPACHSSVDLGPHLRRPKQQLLAPGPCLGGLQRRRRQAQKKAGGPADPGGRRGGGGGSGGRRHLLGSMGGLSPPLSFSALFSEKAPSLGCFSLSTGGEPQA